MLICFQNVLDELIVYRHSVGNVKGDYISLSVSDGDFQAEGTLAIVIGIVNDETPRMSVNRGLRVNSGKDLRNLYAAEINYCLYNLSFWLQL